MREWLDDVLRWWLLPFIPKWVKPNHVTTMRVLGAPVAALCCMAGLWFVAFVLFVFSAVSDYLDGWLARAQEQFTDWGKRADELADKLLLFAFFAAFAYVGTLSISLDSVLLWAFVLTLLRELVITLARRYEWVRYRGVLWSARVKTTLQMVAVGILILAEQGDILYMVGVSVFVVATYCALYSAWWYLRGEAVPVKA